MVISLKIFNSKKNYFVVKRTVNGVKHKASFYFDRYNIEEKNKAQELAKAKDDEWIKEGRELRDIKIKDNFTFNRKMVKDGCLRGFTMTVLHNRYITLTYVIHVDRIRYSSSVNLGKKYTFDEGFLLLVNRYLSIFDQDIVETEAMKKQVEETRIIMKARYEEYSKSLTVR